MFARRNRPTAFEVSFPDEFKKPLPDLKPSNTTANVKQHKRRRSQVDRPDSKPSPAFKYDKPIPTRHWRPDESADRETSTTIIPGEVLGQDDDKPIRYLQDFQFFDPRNRYKFVDLLDLEKYTERRWEGSGKALALIEEEDAGQEDDIEETAVLLRLSPVLKCTVEYTKHNAPFYVETRYALYQLVRPSTAYLSFYRSFYVLHRAAQIIISTLLNTECLSDNSLLDDVLGREFNADDFINAYQIMLLALENTTHRALLQTPLLKAIAERNGPHVSALFASSSSNRRKRPNTYVKRTVNIDQQVIAPENQNQTTITPLIGHLASGYHKDFPYVLEYQNNVNERLSSMQVRDERSLLVQLLKRYANGPAKVAIDSRYRTKRNSQYLHQVQIDGNVFKVDDVVILPMDDLELRIAKISSQDELSGIIADYFWFARILYIDGDTKRAHVHWFEHASQTTMENVSNPRELFLTPICDYYALGEILGKIPVKYLDMGQVFKSSEKFEYFYKFEYVDGIFRDIRDINIAFDSSSGNCPVCPIFVQADFDSHPQAKQGGYAYHGHVYHEYDFINFLAVDGPCKVGQIIAFESDSRANIPHAIVNLLGCMDDIDENRPRDYVKDERHLYLTNDVDRISVADIIRKIYVVLPHTVSSLEVWKGLSPANFYVEYRFPSVKSRSWAEEFSSLVPTDVAYCQGCFSRHAEEVISLEEFYAMKMERSPLRALDIFAGVGAFGLAMELSCPMKVTHAIEISPSAARSLVNYAPGTVVYNQCATEMLRYAVDVYNDIYDDVPKSIEGEALSQPPQPRDIDVIIAGFPCQPHSRLNMFQRANDRKSHLILNLLSWVDFLRPRFCVFENVRGFLNYNTGSVQAGKHRVEGGITMGGLKLLIKCMVAMDYQTRYALLQAGHYGSPQTRIRFFMIAAQRGEVLPDFPQPTHDFPLKDALKIKFPNGKDVQPIQTLRGTAPNRFVTIDDAIGDLPLFDWKGTKTFTLSGRGHSARERTRNIPVLECDRSKGRCGLEGEVAYRSEPMNSFQSWCRKKKTKNLQHITRTLKEDTIDRVVHIPLLPKADYRDLPKGLWDWQISNPASAAAKSGFSGGLYGRLDKKLYFHTTVANVEPTAKQSWVLHPECKRVLTVRELARSQGFPDDFVFYSINDNVKTMHRQIGNAVPWPVSRAIGREFLVALWKRWLERPDSEKSEPASAHIQDKQSLVDSSKSVEYLVISDTE